MGIGGEDLTIVRSGLEIYNLNAQQLSRSNSAVETATRQTKSVQPDGRIKGALKPDDDRKSAFWFSRLLRKLCNYLSKPGLCVQKISSFSCYFHDFLIFLI